MNRYIKLLALTSVVFVLVGIFLVVKPVMANHEGNCMRAPITTPSINNIATVSGIDAPIRVKECMQDNYNRLNKDMLSITYLEQDEYTVLETDTTLSTNMVAVAWVSPTSAITWRNVRTVTGRSAVAWPGSTMWNAFDLISYPSGNQFNKGDIPPDQSRGALLPVKIDATKLRPGVNQVAVQVDLIMDLPPGHGCAGPSGPTPPPCTDSSIAYFLIMYNPTKPPTGNVFPPSGSPNSTCDSLNGTLQDPDAPGLEIDGKWFMDGVYKSTFTTSGHKFTIPISTYKDAKKHNFKIYANGVRADGTPDTQSYFIGETDVGPCVTPSCNSVTTSPSSPEAGQSFDIALTFNAAIGGGAPPANFSVNFTGFPAPLAAYNGLASTSSSPISPGVPGGSATKIGPGGPGGQYNGMATVSGDVSLSCPITIIISAKPYFRVYSGDTLAGFKPSAVNCPGWAASTSPVNIKAYHDSTAGKGAAGQLAVLALDQIFGFASSSGATSGGGATGYGGSVLNPKYLTFANSGAGVPSTTFGGGAGFSYGSSTDNPGCPPDYYNSPSKPASATPAPAGGINLSGFGSGSYRYSGDLEINTSTLNPGQKLAIYVDGKVIIKGTGINYNTGASWSVGTIPSLYIIAKGGNIYVEQSVTSLDGNFVAQPDSSGTGGRFYSCATGASAPSTAFIAASCRSKLTINGSVIAQHLRLFRVNGSQFQSSPNEADTSSSIAEVFNSGPETWLTSPAPFPPSGTDKYDAISSMPPVL